MRRVAAMLALLAGLVGCSLEPQVEPVDFRVPVTASEVAVGAVEDVVVATGTLRAAETATLTVETPGLLRVARMDGRRLAEGDRVERGDLVAEITGEDARVAAGVESALSRYQTALRDHESKQRLFEEGLITAQELRESESRLAETRLSLDQSRLAEERTHIVAPIDGVVLRLARNVADQPVADGQRVGTGFVVAEIAPLDELVADADLVAADAARVEVGMPARIRHLAWDESTFPGEVARLAPAHDRLTRTFRAEVAVENDGAALKPGMFVEIAIVAERREEVPLVPREAVTERDGRAVVFTVSGQRAERREVATGLGDDDVVEVREGVEPGERVVVRGLETLTDGTRVRVGTR
jgi:multidrug efflux system membrane fusion protein